VAWDNATKCLQAKLHYPHHHNTIIFYKCQYMEIVILSKKRPHNRSSGSNKFYKSEQRRLFFNMPQLSVTCYPDYPHEKNYRQYMVDLGEY